MTQVTLLNHQRRINRCRRCIDAGYISQARPVFHGTQRASLMVIGQAPATPVDERPLPFSGQSGRTLQRWLERAGFEESALHDPDRFYLTSVTKCFPGRSSSGNGDRAPSKTEVDLCRDHLDGELRLVQPEIILALGRLSICTFLPSVRRQRLDEIIGVPRPNEYPPAGEAIVLALPHPSGVSRWLNQSANRVLVDRAMDWLGAERVRRGW